jgi:putative ABC transport system ATP-binding protein
VRLEAVSKSFAAPTTSIDVLTEVSLEVGRGESIAVTGPSGSGKTTLLNIVAGLDRPTGGTVITLGRRLAGLRERQLAAFRAGCLGLVFQDPHLLPGLTALENVVAAKLPWRPRRELVAQARELLDAVGLGHRVDFPPARLSGGERQRVGIARALVGRPLLLLADEPTGNLDAATTEELLALLTSLRERFELTFVVATHDRTVAGTVDRIVRLVDGRLEQER